ncbi:MAG: RsmB/NOP family class I SAM-dependent RNA methyltransferase [Candidatus Odinarchaeota archaeon]
MESRHVIQSSSLLEKWKLIYGEIATEQFLQAFSGGKIQALRVNTLRTSINDLVHRLSKKGFVLEKKIPKCGFRILKASFSPGTTTEYLAGHFFLQGLSSQLAAEILSPRPDQLVIDVTAAPGGKTSHMAQLMQNRGVIIAIERSKRRLLSFKNNLQRCGVTNCIGFHGDTRIMLSNQLPLMVDKIIVDAPCTGTGTLHKNVAKLETYKLEDSLLLSDIQLNILESAFSSLAPGGDILYCTCSMEPEENEMVVHRFLMKFEENVEVIKINLELPNVLEPFNSYMGEEFREDMENCVRIKPTEDYEGFFMALLSKVE